MSSTEEKLDALIESVAALTERQKAKQCDLGKKLKTLQKDVAVVNEDATERALKEPSMTALLSLRERASRAICVQLGGGGPLGSCREEDQEAHPNGNRWRLKEVLAGSLRGAQRRSGGYCRKAKVHPHCGPI